jgi:hypothetical protein
MDSIFTRTDLIAINVAMKFIQESFYTNEEDRHTDTYKTLKSIMKKCKDALEE